MDQLNGVCLDKELLTLLHVCRWKSKIVYVIIQMSLRYFYLTTHSRAFSKSFRVTVQTCFFHNGKHHVTKLRKF